jgi:cell division septal protein FtsQ
MFKKRTSKVRHSRQLIRLQAHVVSPRIVWFTFLKSCRKMVKSAVILALLGGAAWGVHEGIQRGLVENKEFRLQEIKLTPNPALDEARLVELAGINLNGSLFECDASKIEAGLRALPEVASASVRREFPGTLVVEVAARQPYAWISSASQGIAERDPKSGLLVDRAGIAFPCPPALFDSAAKLPVFQLGEGGEPLVAGKPVEHPEYSRLARLYQVACQEIRGADQWVYSLSQSRAWSLELSSRDGTEATFGLGDHSRQMSDFKAALDHAREHEQQIASINLIPERNIPVTLRGEGIPRAILINGPVTKAKPDRRSRDVDDLLNR